MKIGKDQLEMVKSNLEHTLDNVKSNRLILPENQDRDKIKSIILGRHLTFRYMLITALASKAVMDEINPLALQTGSKLSGAYDARSVAHKVIVPFERANFSGMLGGSNEPYLNKPARFTEIRVSNPARAGNDRKEQATLVDLLTDMTSAKAQLCLNYTIKLLLEKKKESQLHLSVHAENITHSKLRKILKEVVTHNDGGQSLPLVIGTLLRTFFAQLDADSLKVEVHKVNEAGSSSNEVGDIDIIKNHAVIATFEAKDKKFSQKDVEHAAMKAVKAGLGSLFFIYHGQKLSENTSAAFEKSCEQLGCSLSLMDIDEFTTFIFGFLDSIDLKEVAGYMTDILDSASMTPLIERRVNEIIANNI